MLVELHDSFYIDHLLHLGTSFYYTGRGTGINLETCFELRKDTSQQQQCIYYRACLLGGGGPAQVGEVTRCPYTLLHVHPTYHVNVIKLKCEIIWTGSLHHLSRLPHLATWGPPLPCKQALTRILRILLKGAEKKIISSSLQELRVKYSLTREEKFCTFKPPCNVLLYLLFQHQGNTKPFYFNVLFAAKGMIYHVTIATVIFSHGKRTCYFHV